MNLCNHCQAELVCEHVPSNRIYQCPVCGCPNTIGESEGKAGLSKYARKSLFYALGAILLFAAAIVLLFLRQPLPAGFAGPPMFILGIVATYFALRSFLLARYQPYSTRSKFEAISGAVGGGCLGIFVGGIVSLSLIVSLIAMWFTVETRDQKLVSQALELTARFDLPESIEFVPSVARKTAVRKRIELWDNKNFGACRNRLYLMWTNSVYTTQWGSAETNRKGIRERSIEMITGAQAYRKTEPVKTEQLKWAVHGEMQDITKVTWNAKETKDQMPEDIQYVTYQCLFDANHNTYCITFLSMLPDATVSEAEIRAVFESFEPVGRGW